MATKLSSLVMKNYFIEEMSQIIDEERKITHEKFADKMENALTDERMYKQLKFPADVRCLGPCSDYHKSCHRNCSIC
jgi:nucleosome binding factor SPN SPT16 subunit